MRTIQAAPASLQQPARPGVWSLVVFLAVCYAAAGVGGAITAQVIDTWYPTLRKPEWAPPDALFGPVWTVLYGMMAVAGWLVWRRREHPAARGALRLFALQLALNVAWTAVFFGLRSPGLGLAEIGLLLAAILATTVAFWRIRPLAGALFLPYLAWVSFATALNAAIWSLNR